MRTAVIGAGLIGVTTASELATEGHEVTVFERRGSIAAEASFAHAGLTGPGNLVPWSDPLFAQRLWSRALKRSDATGIVSRLDPSTLMWLWRRRAASQPKRLSDALSSFHRLAAYSHERLRAMSAALDLDHETSTGCLVLFRDARSAARIHARLSAARELGLRIDPLDADQCRAVEPGLNPGTPLFGGVHLPQVDVGNARQFTLLMRNEAQRLGVRFQLQSDVVRLHPGARPSLTWAAVQPGEVSSTPPLSPGTARIADVSPTEETFDAIVLCTGTSSSLLRHHRVRVPAMPIHGWSLTAPMRVHEAHPDHGPRSAVIDERSRVAIGRIGGRIRVSGGLQLGGPLPTQDVPDVLYRTLDDWFPGTLHTNQVQRWSGTRLTTPDGLPLIGTAGLEGVWLNLSHGAAGWSLASGSARLIADALARRTSAIDTGGFGLERWS